MDFLFDPFDTIDYGNGYIAHGYSSSYKEPIHDAFIEYLNKNWDKVAYDINREGSYSCCYGYQCAG